MICPIVQSGTKPIASLYEICRTGFVNFFDDQFVAKDLYFSSSSIGFEPERSQHHERFSEQRFQAILELPRRLFLA